MLRIKGYDFAKNIGQLDQTVRRFQYSGLSFENITYDLGKAYEQNFTKIESTYRQITVKGMVIKSEKDTRNRIFHIVT